MTCDNSPVGVEVCAADPDQARLVMQWRNDPVTLAMSYHHEPKTWPAFWAEWCDSYLPVDPPALFAIAAGERVGFIRFRQVPALSDENRSIVDISIIVDPGRRGGGLAAPILRAAVAFVARGATVDAVLAEVRAGNVASHRAFERAGFQAIGEEVKVIEDTGEACAIRRYLHDLRDFSHD